MFSSVWNDACLNNQFIHVFDHTIKPILLYGSEIWGSVNTQTAKFKNGGHITLDNYF